MAVKEQPESEDFLSSTIDVSGLSPGQELSVIQYRKLLKDMHPDELRKSNLYLYATSVRMLNTIRIQQAQLLDAQGGLPGFSCEEDLKKRLDLQK